MKNKILTLVCICLLAGCSTGSKDKEIARFPLDLYMEVEVTDAHTLRVEMDNQSGYTMDFPKEFTLEDAKGKVQEGTFICEKTTLEDLETVTFTIDSIILEKGNYTLTIGDTSQTFEY